MKHRLARCLLLLFFLTSCLAATPPPPITASVNEEFTLRPSLSATISETDLTVTLVTVSSDQRCPLEMECAASGPVSLSITIQKGENPPVELLLQTFTDNDGRAPVVSFEGIQDRMEFEGYIIQVKSVLPYPIKRSSEIKDSEYQVSFIVIPQ